MSDKGLFFFQILISILCYYFKFSADATCSKPRSSSITIFSPLKNEYEDGEEVEYSCNTPYNALIGSEILTCESNGQWSDKAPKCMRPAKLGLVTLTRNENSPTLAIDKNTETCASAEKQFAADYAAHLHRESNVIAVRVNIPEGFYILTVLVENSKKRTVEICDRVTDSFTGNTWLLFTCEKPLVGDIVHLKDDNSANHIFRLCEIAIYTKEVSKSCRCENGGTCEGSSGKCRCPDGYIGDSCEIKKECGHSDSKIPFITNGNETVIGQWPWQVAIYHLSGDNGWEFKCGGSLINEKIVITAAHCVTDENNEVIKRENIRIYLGKYFLDPRKDDSYVQTFSIGSIHIHPKYEPGTYDADIALIELSSKATFNSRVKPICLPNFNTAKQHLVQGSVGKAIGWGFNERGKQPDALLEANLPIVTSTYCAAEYAKRKMPIIVTENMFCAGYPEGKYDVCGGDSGGPMMFFDESEGSKRWILEGIVSWGSPVGCMISGHYSGFTRVYVFTSWVQDIMRRTS